MTISEHRLEVPRSARYYLWGDPASDIGDLWVVLHGYGQLARDLLAACHPLAGPGRLLVAPEALSRFYGGPADHGGHAETAVGASWMTREDREHEIADYVRYLDLLHRRIVATLSGPPARLHVLGFSQGAATAARWATLGAVTTPHLVLWAGIAPADLGQEALARLRGVRVDCVHGEHDAITRPADIAVAADRLTAAGAEVRTMTFPGGHRLDSATLHRLVPG